MLRLAILYAFDWLIIGTSLPIPRNPFFLWSKTLAKSNFFSMQMYADYSLPLTVIGQSALHSTDWNCMNHRLGADQNKVGSVSWNVLTLQSRKIEAYNGINFLSVGITAFIMSAEWVRKLIAEMICALPKFH